MPLWGNVGSSHSSPPDFEWPTQEDWATMSPDVKLESIEFKKREVHGYSMSSVRVNLSNE